MISLPQPESVPVFFSISLIFPHRTFSQSETAGRTHYAHARIKELRRTTRIMLRRTHSTSDGTFKHTGDPQDPADTKPLSRDGKTRSMHRHTDPGQRNCPVRRMAHVCITVFFHKFIPVSKLQRKITWQLRSSAEYRLRAVCRSAAACC